MISALLALAMVILSYACGMAHERYRVRNRLYGQNRLCPGCSAHMDFKGTYRHGAMCPMWGRDV